MSDQPYLQGRVRDWLGLTDIHLQLHRQEHTMAKVIDLLNQLAAQQTAASAAQATAFSNIDAAFAKLQQALADGDASPDVQAAVDQLNAGLTALQTAADTEAHTYAPTDPGNDQPPADNGGDTPVTPTPDQPVTPDNGDEPVTEQTKRNR